MKSPHAIAALSALAHEHRLRVYRLLVEQGPDGLPAGVIAERLGVAPSTLTFHLQHLTRAGLLTQRRVSRQLYYAADFTTMNDLIAYLTDNCCAAASERCTPECAPLRPQTHRKAAGKQRA